MHEERPRSVAIAAIASVLLAAIAGSSASASSFGVEDGVLLDLGNVVRDVVDDVHVEIVRCALEGLGECLAHEERHRLPIDPRKVGGGRHGCQIRLALLRVDASTRKLRTQSECVRHDASERARPRRDSYLTIIELDVVASHGLLHVDQRVGGDLVAETAAPAVDQDAHLVLVVDAHLGGGVLVVDLLDHLHLAVVIAGTESTQLRTSHARWRSCQPRFDSIRFVNEA